MRNVQIREALMNFEHSTAMELFGPFNETEAKYAPKQIWYSGSLEWLKSGGRVSIVGSRKVTPNGANRAKRLTKILVSNDVVVVSGLAEGVDSIAHQTAISEGGRTIGVVGTGIDRQYPKANADLQLKMQQDHLVVSQFPLGTPPTRKNFPQRNRTMAMISDATVIIEASQKSGTVHQGWEAIRLGRPLFLLKSLLSDPDIKWTREMMDYGALVLDDQSVDTLLECLPQRDPNWEEYELAL